MSRLRRILKHLTTPARTVERAFPKNTRAAVAAAVAEVAKTHDVVLRVFAEAQLPLAALLRNDSPRRRAIALFTNLRVWDTEHNCGVLIYVQLADQRIEIVADRGISAKVTQDEWNAVCRKITRSFKAGKFEEGAMLGVAEIGALIRTHVPPRH